MKLSPRRRKFAAEYVKNGFNGTKAVFAAGYNMGYNSASVEAYRLLRNPQIAKAVENYLNKSKMDAEEVLERLAEIARTDAKFSGSDVVKANELLGKGHKLFTEKVEHSFNPKELAQSTLNQLVSEYGLDQDSAKSIVVAEFGDILDSDLASQSAN